MNRHPPAGPPNAPPNGRSGNGGRLDVPRAGGGSGSVPSLRPEGSSTHGGSSTAPLTASDAAPRTLRVEHGDTLPAIARRVYGHASRWPLIFDANRDRLDDPDLIYPGQLLLLPDVPPDA